MNLKLYTGFGFVAMASAIVALIRIVLGQDPQEVVPANLVISGVCLVFMGGLFYRDRRPRRITNGT